MASFWCSKEVVREIAEYQLQRGGGGYDDEFAQVMVFLEKQPDVFGYEEFTCVLSSFMSAKMHGLTGRFIEPFKVRMRHYKRGKDWRHIR